MSATSLASWSSLWAAIDAKGDPQPWHTRLLAAYAQPERHYHNLQHIAECLRELESTRSISTASRFIAAALWFHDAIYDPRSPTNEEDSAALAIECLTAAQIDPAAITRIRDLILCTKRHDPAGIPDAALLIDIDLAILGQPPPRFWDYEAAIRAEYAWVPWATYAEKRAAILTHFLHRPAIYRTESFQTRYEAPARANLTAALARLGASSG